MSVALALHRAIRDRLLATPALAAVPVHDRAPAQAGFPFLQIGDVEIVNDEAGCIDGVEAYVAVQVWSRKPGRVELRTLAAAARDALHHWIPDLAADNARCVDMMVTAVTDNAELDGETTRAIIRVRALVDREAAF